jgi:hypothetical protein
MTITQYYLSAPRGYSSPNSILAELLEFPTVIGIIIVGGAKYGKLDAFLMAVNDPPMSIINNPFIVGFAKDRLEDFELGRGPFK